MSDTELGVHFGTGEQPFVCVEGGAASFVVFKGALFALPRTFPNSSKLIPFLPFPLRLNNSSII